MSTASPTVAQLDTQSASVGLMPGVEVAFGKSYCCCWGWQFSFWGAWAEGSDQFTDVTSTSVVDTFSDTDVYPVGVVNTSVETFFNNNNTLRVSRRNEIYNAELNFFRFGCIEPNPCGPVCDPCDPCNPCGGCQTGCGPRRFSGSFIGGFRYLSFSESFAFSSILDPNGVSNQDITYGIHVRNFLFGPQFGGSLEYQCSQRCSVFGGLKFGLYFNHIEHQQRIGGSDDTATLNTGPFAGTEYDFISEKDDLSTMVESNVGIAYQFLPNWRAVAGYRVIGISGLALAPGQIPLTPSFVPSILLVNSSDALILHGGFAGVEFAY